jgi:hypothetical protein
MERIFFPLISLLILGGVGLLFLFIFMKVNLITLKKFALALSIVVVLNLFFNVGIGAFYQEPKYEDFCGLETRQYYETKEACETIGGEWIGYADGGHYPKPVRIVEPALGPGIQEPREYCDAQVACRKEHQTALNLYNRNVFIVLVVLGAVSVALGIFFSAVAAISSGFLYGGLLSFLIGTTRYWSNMDEYLRFIILGIVLAALVWVGWKKLKD